MIPVPWILVALVTVSFFADRAETARRIKAEKRLSEERRAPASRILHATHEAPRPWQARRRARAAALLGERYR